MSVWGCECVRGYLEAVEGAEGSKFEGGAADGGGGRGKGDSEAA